MGRQMAGRMDNGHPLHFIGYRPFGAATLHTIYNTKKGCRARIQLIICFVVVIVTVVVVTADVVIIGVVFFSSYLF